MMNTQNNKIALRKLLINKRIFYKNRLSVSKQQDCLHSIFSNFWSILSNVIDSNFHKKENINIAMYFPLSDEINVQSIIQALWDLDYNISLPRIIKNSLVMKFLEYSKYTALEANHYGIKEPHLLSTEVIPNIIVLPLVGFDEDGNRIGYGKGYYDNTISALSDKKIDMIKIALGYEFQKVITTYPEDHDIKLNYMATEDKIYNFNI